jgi:hypothetical protein
MNGWDYFVQRAREGRQPGLEQVQARSDLLESVARAVRPEISVEPRR